jgi:hypothetical protein
MCAIVALARWLAFLLFLVRFTWLCVKTRFLIYSFKKHNIYQLLTRSK